jgi:hypothetical protein
MGEKRKRGSPFFSYALLPPILPLLPVLPKKKPKQSFTFKFLAQNNFFSPSKLYIKLTTDILPRALCNSYEEIFRIKTLDFFY